MRRSTQDLLEDNYGLVAKDLFTPLLDVFFIARSTCQGDLERAVILLEVAIRTLDDPRDAESAAWPGRTARRDRDAPRSTNMRSIADSSGIPKETVRRKVAALVAEGIVVRQGHRLTLSPAAAPVFTPLRTVILKLAARNYETVSAVHDRRG